MRIFLDSKITADDDCSNEIKRHLLLQRKVMTNLDSILKSRDTTLQTEVCLVKAMVFPVGRYGCESWTIKKVEHLPLNCGVVRVPWTARRSNQSILKEISMCRLVLCMDVLCRNPPRSHLLRCKNFPDKP